MPVYAPTSLEEYERILRSRPLIVVCFYVQWSLPCTQILPTYELYSNHHDYQWLEFYKVDCDFEPMIKRYSEGRPNERPIVTIPAFFLFRNGVKIDQEIGGHTTGLPTLLRRHFPTPVPTHRQPIQQYHNSSQLPH